LWDELSSDQFNAAENRAKSLHLQVLSTKLERPPYDFNAAFRSVIGSSPHRLLILSSPHFIAPRRRLADLASPHRVPGITIVRFYAGAGMRPSRCGATGA